MPPPRRTRSLADGAFALLAVRRPEMAIARRGEPATVVSFIGRLRDECLNARALPLAISPHWSTVFNRMQIDQAQFRQETDPVLRLPAE